MGLNLDKVVTFRMPKEDYEDLLLLVEAFNVKGISEINNIHIRDLLTEIQKGKDRKGITLSAGDIIRLAGKLLVSEHQEILDFMRQNKKRYIEEIQKM